MQRQHEYFYGAVLAVAGFCAWAVFSLLPLLTGAGRIKEGWDTPPYWLIGIPTLIALHVLAGALADVRSSRLPLWTISGHIVAMVLIQKSGVNLGLLPIAIVLVGVPMYGALYLATRAGQALRHAT